jgi:hypothetical protein
VHPVKIILKTIKLMIKIIAAFDGLKYSTSTRDYAIALSKLTKAHLVGVFLEDRSYTGYKIYDLIEDDGISPVKLKQLSQKDKAARATAVRDFDIACREAGLEYTIHRDRNIALHELKLESIYADLLVIDMNETITHYTEKPPTRFIRTLLSGVQCPVLLVPAKYKPIQKVTCLYDGSPSSVLAVKMMSYLLPQLKDIQTGILTIKPMKAGQHIPHNHLMKEFMKRHYPAATYTVVTGIPEQEIIRCLKLEKENPLVVLGAYNRGTVSRWFKESMADRLMKELKLPLLIAHG